VAARRLAGALTTAAPFAGNVAVVAIGHQARFVDPAAVAALTMNVLYGTNFHHGLMLARKLNPRRIVLIAYSAPTAHWMEAEQGELFVYPPGEDTLALTRLELERVVGRRRVLLAQPPSN